MTGQKNEKVDRRQVLGAGVAGAALLVLPEGCSSGGGKGAADASHDAVAEAATCPTRTINIMQAGIAKQGTSYEFTDSCYMDPNCSQGAIILVHPVTKDVFVAMSGACPHLCCAHVDGNPGPAYYAAFPPPMDAGAPSTEAGSSEAGISEAGAESGATDGGPTDGGTHETGSPDAGDSDAGMVMQDVLYCDCHGSIFNALDGTVIQGPAMEPLQLLKTTESGASVLIEIPDNGSTGSGTGPGAP